MAIATASKDTESARRIAITSVQNGSSTAPAAIDESLGTFPKTIWAMQMDTASVPKKKYTTAGALNGRRPAKVNANSVGRARIGEMPNRCGTEYVPLREAGSGAAMAGSMTRIQRQGKSRPAGYRLHLAADVGKYLL